MIPFNIPTFCGTEIDYIQKAIESTKISGDGQFTKLCSRWLEKKANCTKVLLTTSCTHSLEMSAILCNVKPGDEVIMPSFTFCSTADAFVQRGASIVFVDIRPDTMNIDEELIVDAITPKTKVIVPVHYAGVSCEMDSIVDIANTHNLKIVEDAAQAIMSSYKERALGTIGDFGCFSFHETKNFCMGEGGAILIRNESYIDQAEILREKGTNRSKFFRGQIDKYTWVDYGSSYLPSELNAAFLWAQLSVADEINSNRINAWNYYYKLLKPLEEDEYISLPYIPKDCVHNAHMFYCKVKDLEQRTKLLSYLLENNVLSVFHYIPLHSAPAGLKFGRFHGEDRYTTRESERLLRLPLYYNIKESNIEYIANLINVFYRK